MTPDQGTLRIKIAVQVAIIVAIDLQWEKMKIGIYCYLIADVFTKLLQKCFLEMSSTKYTFFIITS